jgi:hypothetical protein
MLNNEKQEKKNLPTDLLNEDKWSIDNSYQTQNNHKKPGMGIDMEMLDEIIKRVRNLNPDQQRELLEILETWQTGKQRNYQRLPTKTQIDVAIGNRVIQTEAKDISAGGVFIKASGKFDTHKDVRLVFSVPGYNKPFKLKGMIVRVEQNGIAIEFENMTPYFKKILDEVIWKNKQPDDDFS